MDAQSLSWKVSEFLMIPALRVPLTGVSAFVQAHTGVWLHPCMWQTAGLLVATIAAYRLYLAVAGLRA